MTGTDAPSHPSPLADLDQRARDIFRRIVESYLETGEPLGSRTLSKGMHNALSPASVRNVMADLEDLGLVYAPHVSAGRLPTERGLRFFLDGFLEVGRLGETERRVIETELRASGDGRRPEDLFHQAGTMLSGLSRAAGVVLVAKSDLKLRHIEFVQIDPLRALVVLVGEDGSVENRMIDLPAGTLPSTLSEATNRLNALVKGRTLMDVRKELSGLEAGLSGELDTLTRQVVEAGLATWSGASGGQPRQLIVRGQANLLEDVKALEDLERVRQLFSDIEEKRELIEFLGLAEKGDGVRVFIGSETKLFSLSGSSVIVSPYRDAETGLIGVLGVIGPTRLNYARIVPSVDYTARLISRLLG
ncbi:MAG: heat-inducible transcriptional repressor HrcA [Hyphomicrobiaceae bacterium]|nr:heat-inducible transcriptional repressor HrcA [Hyphomicrobiaceae bacterium]